MNTIEKMNDLMEIISREIQKEFGNLKINRELKTYKLGEKNYLTTIYMSGIEIPYLAPIICETDCSKLYFRIFETNCEEDNKPLLNIQGDGFFMNLNHSILLSDNLEKKENFCIKNIHDKLLSEYYIHYLHDKIGSLEKRIKSN